jgi:hypothetical protein
MTDLAHRFDENVYDLNAILHPGSVFGHPRDVLSDATLSRSEKRAILASLASDAAAVTSCPALRAIPGAKSPVSIDDILEALSSLDHSPRTPPGGKPARLKSTDRGRLNGSVPNGNDLGSTAKAGTAALTRGRLFGTSLTPSEPSIPWSCARRDRRGPWPRPSADRSG